MESRLFRYIWRHSKYEQLTILAIVAVSMVFYFLALDLPKAIVNEAIQGDSFPDPEATALFMHVELPALWGGGEPIVLFEGFHLERLPYLLALSMVFLALVIINGALKYFVNTLKGRLGERMLRRLRHELFDRLQRFPLPYFRRLKPAEVATMIKDEIEPLGGFIGDAFVTPAFLGGQAATAMVFILAQSVWLGGVALVVVLGQAIIIPRLRRRILALARQRQLAARNLAGRIAENVEGIAEVHANDTSNYERADVAERLGRIFAIRYAIYRRKFFVKSLNNFLSNLTPFFFYSVGGALVIKGAMDIGALVAVIAAYKDLPSPVKELIDWDQQRLDVQIKYNQVIEQFQPENMLDPALQSPDGARSEPLTGEIVLSRVSYQDDTGANILDSVSFEGDLSQRIGVTGPPGSGKNHLAMLVARLLFPTSGSIRIDGVDLEKASEAVTGRRIAYVGPEAYLFPVSVRDNILYGLKHVPVRPPEYDEEERRQREQWFAEARRVGNVDFDIRADWIDYEAAGVDGPEEMSDRIIEVLRLVDLEEDIYQLGLKSAIDPATHPKLAESALRAREALRERLKDPEIAALIEPFDANAYNTNATLAENLLFGTPVGDEFDIDHLAENAYVLQVLDKLELTDDLVEMGRNVAETMVELFAGLAPGNEFFEQFGFISSEDLPEFQALLSRSGKLPPDRLPPEDRRRLLSLPFKLIVARHRLGLIDEEFQKRIVEARHVFARDLPEDLREAVEFFDVNKYNAAATLQDNILLGRVVYGQAHATTRIGALVGEVLEGLGLRKDVVIAGLDYHVGTAGSRLSGAQRQKVALARALIKRPDLIVIDEATAALDSRSQNRIRDNLLEHANGRGLFWVLHRAGMAAAFDKVLVMDQGRIVEQGTFDELNREGTLLRSLVEAD